MQEDVEYTVDFESGGKPFALIIKLSPEFPLEKPILHISPPVVHHWVSETGEITSAPGLLNVSYIVSRVILLLHILYCFAFTK